jgi:ferredoxin-NADP reductase
MTRNAESWDVKVAEIQAVSPRVKQFRLVAASGELLPGFSPGSHILVTMEDGSRTMRNAYSLMGSIQDTSSYCISVLHVENSRGGSRFLHEQVAVGSALKISRPLNLFPVHRLARKYLLIAGGIGITPFLPMMEEMSAVGIPFELHYSVRDMQSGAYCAELVDTYTHRVRCYRTRERDGESGRMSIASLLNGHPLGTHLYVCGPTGLIESVLQHARVAGWPEGSLHAERFSSEAGAAWKPFDVELAKSKRLVHVRQEETLLEALEAAGVEVPYLCRGGACGQCETAVLPSEAALLHNDHYLNNEKRNAGTRIVVCVSRATAGRLILDL